MDVQRKPVKIVTVKVGVLGKNADLSIVLPMSAVAVQTVQPQAGRIAKGIVSLGAMIARRALAGMKAAEMVNAEVPGSRETLIADVELVKNAKNAAPLTVIRMVTVGPATITGPVTIIGVAKTAVRMIDAAPRRGASVQANVVSVAILGSRELRVNDRAESVPSTGTLIAIVVQMAMIAALVRRVLIALVRREPTELAHLAAIVVIRRVLIVVTIRPVMTAQHALSGHRARNVLSVARMHRPGYTTRAIFAALIVLTGNVRRRLMKESRALSWIESPAPSCVPLNLKMVSG